MSCFPAEARLTSGFPDGRIHNYVTTHVAGGSPALFAARERGISENHANMAYKHLLLRDWPFRVVPEPGFCDFMADRRELRKEVQQLLSSLEVRPTSDVQVIWSWYGAGKTHTVYYLANQCAQHHQRLLPVYTELPREAAGFADLYRAMVAQFDCTSIIEGFLEFSTRPATESAFRRTLDQDLESALTQAALGDKPLRVLLKQWLLGSVQPPRSLRQLGVGARINTAEKCTTILADLVMLMNRRNGDQDDHHRVIWIIDELQRVDEMRPTARRSILSGVVGVFNRCPSGLTLLFSYTGQPAEEELPAWIPADLKDRIGLERPLLLPPLRSEEAVLLIKELLDRFRLPGSSPANDFHPFERAAVESLVSALSTGGDLKPRTIMEVLDASLRYLEPDIRAGSFTTIDEERLRQSLGRFALKWTSARSRSRGQT